MSKNEFKKKELKKNYSFKEYPSFMEEVKKIISRKQYQMTLSEFIQISLRRSVDTINKKMD